MIIHFKYENQSGESPVQTLGILWITFPLVASNPNAKDVDGSFNRNVLFCTKDCHELFLIIYQKPVFANSWKASLIYKNLKTCWLHQIITHQDPSLFYELQTVYYITLAHSKIGFSVCFLIDSKAVKTNCWLGSTGHILQQCKLSTIRGVVLFV